MKQIGRIALLTLSIIGVSFILTLATSNKVRAAVSALVTVSNTAANPVPNRDQDNPAQQPFQQIAQPDTRGTGQTRAETDFTVPAGKRLVIEYVSAGIAAGNGSVAVETTAGGNPAAYYFINPAAPVSTRGFFPTRIYADPNTNVSVVVTGANTQADVELSGYYVNIP
jgi:hypothetical protein